MLRTIILAATVTLGATAAAAQDHPVLRGSGENAVVEYGGAQPGSVVGGAAVRWSGSGNDTSFAYGAVNAVPGRVARLVGSGENAQVVYGPPVAAPSLLARGAATGSGG